MRYRSTGLIALICAAVLTATNALHAAEAATKPDAKAPKAKLKGLLLTGGCCHDYTNQKRIIADGISQRISITWDIIHEGGKSRAHQIARYKKKDWAKGYDVVVHNECFGGVKDDAFVQGIVNAHKSGTPAVVIHCSMHSNRSAKKGVEAWRAMLGVTTWNHEKHRALDVKNLAPKHPVMKGFPATWKTPNGELYKIQKLWPNATPLAKAYGQDTKKDHVVIWTNTYGKGRVFGTTLGHHNATMQTEVWMNMVSRGVLWSIGKLNDDGSIEKGYDVPAMKPTKKTTNKAAAPAPPSASASSKTAIKTAAKTKAVPCCGGKKTKATIVRQSN